MYLGSIYSFPYILVSLGQLWEQQMIQILATVPGMRSRKMADTRNSVFVVLSLNLLHDPIS